MANKNFKVKNSITIPEPLALTEGGTGQTSAGNALNALLPVQTSATNKYLKSDGTNASWETVASGFTAMPSSSININTTLSSYNKYFVDTTSAITLTLPASPSLGDEIYIYDASNNALTNNITVLPNSNKIQGSVQSLIIDSNSAVVYLAYTGSSYGWDVN
jgi:hypothetical protein